MESIGAVIVYPVILLCLGIFVIFLVLKDRQLNRQIREMEAQNLALVDRILEQRRDFKEKHPGLIEKNETLEAENQALKEEIQKREQELTQAFKEERQRLTDSNKALQDELSKITEVLKEADREIKERPVREWQEWLRGLTKLSYNGEIEVEVKFILPLVKYLGYHESDLRLRVPVDIQVGRAKKRAQADWVLWDRSKQQVRAIIEAKGPTQRLDQDTIAQTRSYALALHTPIYAITNGKRLMVFRCGVQADTRIVDYDVGRLAEAWPLIHEAMGIGPGIRRIA